MNILKYVKGCIMNSHNGKGSKVCSTILSIVFIQQKISSSSLGQQRNILVKIWNEIGRYGDGRWI